MTELEETLLEDKNFQHILKFAPESQRGLMTFELAQYFTAHTRQQVLEARIDELSNHVAEWLVINNETFDAIKDRIAQLKFKGKNL